MIRKSVLAVAMSIAAVMTANAEYKPAGDRIKTEWAATVDPANVWNVYPRPQMKRAEWMNLNGMWDYAIRQSGGDCPAEMDGEILVPFCVESSLSGVGKNVGDENELWYRRKFTVPQEWAGKRVKMNFGAVDWRCEVMINGKSVGGHTGGYAPFSLDVTDALQPGENEVTVRVYDPTDKGYQAVGKQTQRPRSIWYTPVTGIWQTVWLEPVAEKSVESVRILPDAVAGTLSVTVNAPAGTTVSVSAADGDKTVAQAEGEAGKALLLTIPEARLWTPESPVLYGLKIQLKSDGKVTDEVESYAALRSIGMARDESGHMRMQLNGKNYFQFGPLDQGWWPDGLYTAPNYEAMIYDVDKTKELGYNMIRKHVKVEPDVWYAYCDSVGMLVWQDMPSGDRHGKWQNHNWYEGEEMQRTAESEAAYRAEWKEIIDALYSHPSIVVWVSFNESWGQFKTVDITEWTKSLDPDRLVNSASGGNFFHTGDMIDLHNYPGPAMYLSDPDRVNVLGEYGGIGYVVEDHLWVPDRNWGYVKFQSPKEVTDCYVKYGEELLDFVPKGFSAAVYTQTTDVEIEVNGLMTYDRKVMKVEPERIRAINRRIVESLSGRK
ncbi:MAG: beta-galactosidase [Muribaculaceae bacterium]|nr:beta-galactosidase [Muribaculaceae bacterium]